MTDADPFVAARPRLVGVAYRLTGSLADAQDIVQDAWIRWQAAERSEIERPEAWLTTVVTRLALDRLRSATARRVDYVGPWLPEPLVEPLGQDPADAAELADSLTFAFLTLLDVLSPAERVAVVLSDVFGAPSHEVGHTLGRSPEAARQLASRGRAKLRAARAPVAPRPQEWAVAGQLLEAVASGDLRRTAALLAPQIVLVSDGGPQRHAARRPVVGPDRAARFLCNLHRRFAGLVEMQPVTVNKMPGVVLTLDGHTELTMAISVRGDVVDQVWFVVNPDKLRGVGETVELV